MVKDNAVDDLLATSAFGWAAVIDGILNVRTVADGRNAAAMNAIYAIGYALAMPCRDPDCDCLVRLLSQVRPGAKVVRVIIEVSNEPEASS